MEKGSILPRSKAQVQEKFLKSEFKPRGISVEEAREAMIREAEIVELSRENKVQGKVPQFIQNAREREAFKQHTGHSGDTRQITPEPAERGQGGSAATPVEVPVVAVEPAVPEPVQQVPERQAQPAQEPVDTKRQRHEDAQRIIEVYNAGRDGWIANIRYKNGRQPEIFKARSKDDLIMKIAEGKANATMKIHSLNRRIAVGPAFDTWDDFFRRLQKEFNVTATDYNNMPETAQRVLSDQIQLTDEKAFVDMYPEYYATEDNYKAIQAYLKKHSIPFTAHNLQIAYEDLLAQGVLDIRPNEIVAEEIEPEVVQSASTTSVTAPVVTAPVVHSTVEPVAETTAPAPATPVRKRGSTGLIPGSSSAVPSAPVVTEETGNKQRELSEKELRTMDIKDLRRTAIPSLNRPSSRR